MKSQVELLYTNAQELTGVVTGPNLAGLAIPNVQPGLLVSTLTSQVASVVTNARAFYRSDPGGSGAPASPATGLLALITAIENLDVRPSPATRPSADRSSRCS